MEQHQAGVYRQQNLQRIMDIIMPSSAQDKNIHITLKAFRTKDNTSLIFPQQFIYTCMKHTFASYHINTYKHKQINRNKQFYLWTWEEKRRYSYCSSCFRKPDRYPKSVKNKNHSVSRQKRKRNKGNIYVI